MVISEKDRIATELEASTLPRIHKLVSVCAESKKGISALREEITTTLESVGIGPDKGFSIVIECRFCPRMETLFCRQVQFPSPFKS